MNAPTMMINKINRTKMIAAPKPFPHPQLFINHSSFICLFTYILRKNLFLVLLLIDIFFINILKSLKILFFSKVLAIINLLGGNLLMNKKIFIIGASALLLCGCGKVPKLSNGDEAVITFKDGEKISAN